jgi:hypothetical protein
MEKKKNNDKFPGYPHYPAGEDATKSNNNNGMLPLAEENISAPNKTDHLNDREADTRFVSGTDADVTADDLRILDATEQNMNTTDGVNLQHAILDNVDEDGDPLNEEGSSSDFTGESLDVPGSEADDDNEAIGEEDEENNYYSLGGDNHEAQEENKGE